MKAFISLLAMAAIAMPASTASLSRADAAALEQLKNANDAAWNSRDHSTISGQYADGATVRVAPDMPLVEGRRAISDFFEAVFGRRNGEFRHVTALAHLEPIDERTVLGEGDVRVERKTEQGWALVRRFRTITIVVREGGEWKLLAVRAIPLAS